MKTYAKVIIVVAVLILAIAPVAAAKGGGRGGGGGRSSSSSTSRSSIGTRSTTSTPSKPSSSSRSTSSSKISPGSSVNIEGKSINTSSKAPSNSKYKNQAGITGVDSYTPRFTNGYSAPAGSVVYYPQHSFVDYLPWIYLFSQDSPANDSATIIEPDGKEVVAKPEPEGTDGMAIFNWIVLVLMGVGAIALLVLGVNRITSR